MFTATTAPGDLVQRVLTVLNPAFASVPVKTERVGVSEELSWGGTAAAKMLVVDGPWRVTAEAIHVSDLPELRGTRQERQRSKLTALTVRIPGGRTRMFDERTLDILSRHPQFDGSGAVQGRGAAPASDYELTLAEQTLLTLRGMAAS